MKKRILCILSLLCSVQIQAAHQPISAQPNDSLTPPSPNLVIHAKGLGYYNIYLSSNPDEIYRYKAEQSVRQKNKEGVGRFIDGTLIEGIGTADKFYFFFFSNECQIVKATKLEPQTISLCGKTLNIEPYIGK